MNTLERLWTSTTELYERFGIEIWDCGVEERERFVVEECHEFLRESALKQALELAGERNLVSEAADLIVTVLGLLHAHDVDLETFQSACEAIARKNDAKTPENGYQYTNGKIRKQ